MTFATARCNVCRSPIWFGLTIKGHRQPLDLNPSDAGNIIVDPVEMALDTLGDAVDGARVRTLKRHEPAPPDVPRFTAHFATCKGRGKNGR